MPGLALPKNGLDELDVEQRRQVLMDLARAGDPVMAMLGGTPPESPVFVLDTFEDLAAGSEDDALKAFASSSELEVTGPHQRPAGPGSAEVIFEYHLSSFGMPPSVLSSSLIEEEATMAMRVSLRELCGGRVMDLATWAKVQNAGTIEEVMLAPSVPAAPKVKLTPFVVCERVPLHALPLAKIVALQRSDIKERKVRRKHAYELLAEPQGLGSMSSGAVLSDWNLPILHDEGQRYANHHDMLAAVRMGLNIENILPWPCDNSHMFLVAEELRICMRERGYVEIMDFDPTARVKLRTSLPEFTPEITGDKPAKKEKELPQVKPAWPPVATVKQRVVIILNRARLAMEVEPDYETVAIRDIISVAGHLWVEINGPTERRSGGYRKAPKKAPADVKKTPARPRKLEAVA